MEKDIINNGSKKQVGISILILNKIDFKAKLIRREREGHYRTIKAKTTKGTLQSLTSMPQIQGHPHLWEKKERKKNKHYYSLNTALIIYCPSTLTVSDNSVPHS